MIRLTKTFCRNFCKDTLQMDVPRLCECYHRGGSIKRGWAEITFSASDHRYSYEVSFMRWCGGLWLRIMTTDNETEELISDKVRTFAFNWNTGEAGKETT